MTEDRKTFPLEVVTMRKIELKKEVVSLIANGSMGYFGVLARHHPMVSDLVTGVMTLKEANGAEKLYALGSGFLIVERDGVTILTSSCEEACDIDVARAAAARERALKRLKKGPPDTDIGRAQASMQRALTRLKVVKTERPDREGHTHKETIEK